MSYEEAWREIVNITNTVKNNICTDDVNTFILCVEHLQSELEMSPKSND